MTLYFLLSDPPGAQALSLYGFAESSETEINYPAPVAVLEILVRPGQAVDSGQQLLRLVRRTRPQALASEPYRIDELRAEAAARADRQAQELAGRRTDYRADLAELDARATALRDEIAFRESLTEGLATLETNPSDYQPQRRRLERIAAEQERVREQFRTDSLAIVRNRNFGARPYQERIRRLEAEAQFRRNEQEEEIVLTAPAAGLIGALNCRVGEYKNAYANLMTFYEPHSDLVRGYLYEDLTVDVDTGARFDVVSLREPELSYPGRVIGLGSRIVEIPVRLRKYPEVVSYGREVTVAISRENQFLQQEKVGLRYQPAE